MNLKKFLLAAITLLLGSAALAADNKTALIIGNDNYASSPLDNSVNDAKAVAKKLSGMDFDVELVLNADSATLRQAAKAFAEKISRKSHTIALLYYSGHGVQIQDRNILLGVDANPKALEDSAIDVQGFLSSIKPGQDSSYIVILDACREYAPKKDRSGLTILDAPPGTLIALSTSPGRVASDGDPTDGNGLYTKHLVKAMQSPGMPIESVFKKVRNAVISESEGEQIPWENSSLLRDLYLMGANAPTAEANALASRSQAEALSLTAGAAPSQHRLTDFYAALQAASKNTAIVQDQRNSIDAIFRTAYRVQLSDEEIKFISNYLTTLGFHATDVPAYIRQKYAVENGAGAMVWQSDGSGIAEKLGLVDGDIIVELNGRKIVKGSDFRDLLDVKRFSAGETIFVKYLRSGRAAYAEGILERNSPASLLMKLVYEKYRSKEFGRAKELLLGLAMQEDPRALGGLARAYFFDDPEFTGHQYALAFDYAKQAAALGDSFGESTMALAYDMGRGVPQNRALAVQLMQVAADKNRSWAFGMLAKRYLDGLGIPRNPDLALRTAERGAYLGDFNSAITLARMYAQGSSMDKDTQKALAWYERTRELVKNTNDNSPNAVAFIRVVDDEIMALK